MLRLAQSAESSEKVIDPASLAAKDMTVARYYMDKHDHIAAINRFKHVVTGCPACPEVEEALAGLTEAYLTIGVKREAQTAAAVLARKFPDSRWSLEALNRLKSAGLEPVEDERSWISRAFR